MKRVILIAFIGMCTLAGCTEPEVPKIWTGPAPTPSVWRECEPVMLLIEDQALRPNRRDLDLASIDSSVGPAPGSQECVVRGIEGIIRSGDTYGNQTAANQLRILALLAARRDMKEVLPLLVENVELTGISFGLSDAHFVFHDALVEFGSDAVPFLKEKYRSNPNALEKWRIERLLAAIRKPAKPTAEKSHR
jgi:hypothetical protein